MQIRKTKKVNKVDKNWIESRKERQTVFTDAEKTTNTFRIKSAFKPCTMLEYQLSTSKYLSHLRLDGNCSYICRVTIYFN